MAAGDRLMDMVENLELEYHHFRSFAVSQGLSETAARSLYDQYIQSGINDVATWWEHIHAQHFVSMVNSSPTK